MNITTRRSQIRSLKKNDPRFMIQDTFVMVPRAGFEISKQCPAEYRQIIAQCINNGWLNPIAHVTERELLFLGLTKE